MLGAVIDSASTDTFRAINDLRPIGVFTPQTADEQGNAQKQRCCFYFANHINLRCFVISTVIWQYTFPVPAISSAIVNSAVGSNMRSEFISVEIALHSDHESHEWIEWFQKQDSHVEKVSGTDAKWFIYFAPLPSGDVDSTISSLCDEIDNLPEHIKAHWDNAIRRQFFIGFQAGLEWPCLDNRLSHDTLRNVVGLSAELRLAIYPATAE